MLSIKTLCCVLATTLFTQLLIAQSSSRQVPAQKQVTITPEGGNFIPMKQAALLTHQFQHHYKNTNFPYAEKFNKELILKLLQQQGATGLRIYLGEDPQANLFKKNNRKSISLILVAVNQQGVDITKKVPILNGKLYHRKPSFIMVNNFYFQDDGLALENGQQCLSMCNINSSLLYQAQ